MISGKIMIIGNGDEPLVRQLLRVSDSLSTDVQHAGTTADALPLLQDELPDLVLCDHATFRALQNAHPRLCALLYAHESNSEQAIDAIKRGALEYLVKPFSDDALAEHIRHALRVSHDVRVPAAYEGASEQIDRIVGQSEPMNDVYKLIGKIAPRDINVLITGESGTGKELIARALVQHSPRKDQPYLAVHCAAIPETLLESELFGHEKGAFTGADGQHIGRFEHCDGGTIFLDEIGDISLSTQTKLLRVLQDNTIQRLGGTKEIQCDVRIIAATHQPLNQLIKERRFREDLYYRLNVSTIHVPPLRERDIDVIVLAHYFVQRYNARFDTHIKSFSPEALPALLHYHWPGNVRELENTIKSSLVTARGSTFLLEFLPEHIRRHQDAKPQIIHKSDAEEIIQQVANQLARESKLGGQLHSHALGIMERQIIYAALQSTDGQLTSTAKLLGISRTTLRKKMQQLGVSVKTVPQTTNSDHT